MQTCHSSKNKMTEQECTLFLSQISVKPLDEMDKRKCEGYLTENEWYNALQQMKSSKSPGQVGLTKEFYLAFWAKLGKVLISCLNDILDK
jgi:hypothetical protein